MKIQLFRRNATLFRPWILVQAMHTLLDTEILISHLQSHTQITHPNESSEQYEFIGKNYEGNTVILIER
jgi:hypothetical protein